MVVPVFFFFIVEMDISRRIVCSISRAVSLFFPITIMPIGVAERIFSFFFTITQTEDFIVILTIGKAAQFSFLFVRYINVIKRCLYFTHHN